MIIWVGRIKKFFCYIVNIVILILKIKLEKIIKFFLSILNKDVVNIGRIKISISFYVSNIIDYR